MLRKESTRVELRAITLDDSHVMQREFQSWKTVRYLSAGMLWPFPADGARRLIEDVTIPAVERGEEWAWSIWRKGQGSEPIGAISLFDRPNDNRGFWLARNWRGKGFMREACWLANDFWFETLGRDRMRVPKALANVPSRRISEREGMRLIRIEEREYVSGRLFAGIWEMTAAEWVSKRNQWQQESPGFSDARRTRAQAANHDRSSPAAVR